LSCPTKRSGAEAANSVRPTQGDCAERGLRQRIPGHLDEVVVSIGGRKYWLWRAVDQDGNVLDEIVQVHRDTKAAKRLLVRLLKKQGVTPKRIITDKLRSYGAAKRDVMLAIEHRSHKASTTVRKIPICRCENENE
jgi:putative transposase